MKLLQLVRIAVVSSETRYHWQISLAVTYTRVTRAPATFPRNSSVEKLHVFSRERAWLYIYKLCGVESSPSASISHYSTDTNGCRAIRAFPFLANRERAHGGPTFSTRSRRLTAFNKSTFEPTFTVRLKFWRGVWREHRARERESFAALPTRSTSKVCLRTFIFLTECNFVRR